MDIGLLITQSLNGIQFGVLLFLVAAGLTLVLGIMDLVNLAHGSLYMMGAYFGSTFYQWTGSFFLALVLALPTAFLFGILVERLVIRQLYTRSYLEQVLATFGLILFFNEFVNITWGAAPRLIDVPPLFQGTVSLLPGVTYPTYRLFIIAVGLLAAIALYWLVTRTRAGMLIRAGASNRTMVAALGINIDRLFMFVFGFGAALAALAGVVIAPITSVQPGMGDNMLTLALVVLVLGGIGSIRGAFIAALLVGLVDTIGKSFVPDLLKLFLSASVATDIGPALASMLIYIFMAAVLFFSPRGLFRGG
ncbi:branched-chain amino acid ABC transporter permease [Oscillatoria sp. FACHB-1407]|uniref:branched-chain amino acid ABC transporter permease n=1 Tax=Oscillatoria sp. FACHB-1407 TaxID=2692847 RepID=UPI0016899A7C|nr:branched-chain amino acid ABC transporter permease [Oscillatoria sp. FACHB-1407]MBD2465755.1 branched-chain amino acid ABC transporter permease [Oscillatoria sp. FACHB-1407]